MRIKKYNRNEYLLTKSKIWVRDFTETHKRFLDINKNMYNEEDYHLYYKNEIHLFKKRVSQIDAESISYNKIVIVSDGLNFDEKHKLLAKLPKEVVVLTIQDACKKWALMGKDCPTEMKKRINFYITNNPYSECRGYIGSNQTYFPKCLISTRTNSEFIDKYRGDIYSYSPSTTETYSGVNFNSIYKVDDYRNPLSAAIGLAYNFKAKKILLLCCDGSFSKERPASIKLENGLYTYPQQIVVQHVVDGQAHWLSKKEIKVADHSKGIKYDNITYIEEDKIIDFFEE